MRRILLDSSVYIHALRRPQSAAAVLDRLAAGAAVWLSAVVLAELYAGARGYERRVVERLGRAFHAAERMVVPDLEDWLQTGLVLAALGQKYGYEQIGRGRLTNDALIAVSAARQGLTVLTVNRRDFSRLAEFSAVRWELVDLGELPHAENTD